MANILVVDDDDVVARMLARVLLNRGHTVTVAATIREAQEICAAATPDLAVIDVRLPDGEGTGFGQWLLDQGRTPTPEVMYITAYHPPQPTRGEDVLAKPFGALDFEAEVDRLLEGRGG